MIAAKLEQIGDRVVLVLDAEALSALNVRIGDTLSLEPASETVLRVTIQETWTEDAHARGRAFLRRYQRTLDRLT